MEGLKPLGRQYNDEDGVPSKCVYNLTAIFDTKERLEK
jgi:hypothetical protein